jgi:hypothetical protein
MLIQSMGGMLLIIGALTPLAVLGIAGTIIPAIVFLVQRREPFINPRRSQLGEFSLLSNRRNFAWLCAAPVHGRWIDGCFDRRSNLRRLKFHQPLGSQSG